MVLRNAYVLARGASGQATLQHKLADGQASLTLCGRDMDSWSRTYTQQKFDVILCRRCAG